MSRLGMLSRWLNTITGGPEGWSLCARWAEGFGAGCLACRIVGRVLRDPAHCAEELRFYRSEKD